MRLPQDDPARSEWLAKLCLDECSRKDPRVSISHFSQASLLACKKGHGPGGASVSVRLREGALPTVSNDDMTRAAKGSLGRSLRYKATIERHVVVLVAAAAEISELRQEVVNLRSAAVVLNERLEEGAHEKEETTRLKGIDDSFLIDKKPEAVRCLSGLSSHDSLLVRNDTRVQQCSSLSLYSVEGEERSYQ